jgi:predicted transcriptional regulator of viral defense system
MANNKDISTRIKQTISQTKAPAVFFISDFSEFGYEYVRKVLSGMVEDGELVRIANGIYARPVSTRLGQLLPSVEEVVEAIAKHDAAKVLPNGATAEHMLGLTTQVPMNYVYITSGSARELNIGNHTIRLQHAAQKYFAIKNPVLAMLCLAMKSIGKENMTDEILPTIYSIVRKEQLKEGFLEDVTLMPLWIQKIIRSVK